MRYVCHKNPDLLGPDAFEPPHGVKKGRKLEPGAGYAPDGYAARARLEALADEKQAEQAASNAEAKRLKRAIRLQQETSDPLDAPEPMTMLAEERKQDRGRKKAEAAPELVNTNPAGQLERNLPGAEMNLTKIAPGEKVPDAPEKLFGGELDAAVKAELHEAREQAQEVSESWFKRMARGARDVAKAAGGLWSTVTREGQDPAFAPENVFVRGVSEVTENLGGMVTGKKRFNVELEPGVWAERNEPNLLQALGEGVSIYDLGSTLKQGAIEVGSGVGAKVRETITREKEKELKEAAEDFSETPSIAGAFRSLREIFGGAKEAVTQTPRETWTRRQELIDATKYVLGGGFVSEVYSGIKDKLSGKLEKDIADALKNVKKVAAEDGEILLGDQVAQKTGLKEYAPRKTWTTKNEGLAPGEDWESPLAPVAEFTLEGPKTDGGPRGGKDTSRAERVKESARYVAREAAEGLREVASYHWDGLVDLGRGYKEMFKWMAEQYRYYESLPREASLENQRAELRRQAMRAGAERLDVAAAEAGDISKDAVKAKDTLMQELAAARESYMKVIDAAEKKVASRAREILNDKAEGFGVRALMNDKARLERKIDQYKTAIAAIDARAKSESQAEAKATYEAALAEVDTKLNERVRLLENPSLIRGKARDMIKAEIQELNQKADTYEAVMRAMNQLDNLTPEARKESVAV